MRPLRFPSRPRGVLFPATLAAGSGWLALADLYVAQVEAERVAQVQLARARRRPM